MNKSKSSPADKQRRSRWIYQHKSSGEIMITEADYSEEEFNSQFQPHPRHMRLDDVFAPSAGTRLENDLRAQFGIHPDDSIIEVLRNRLTARATPSAEGRRSHQRLAFDVWFEEYSNTGHEELDRQRRMFKDLVHQGWIAGVQAESATPSASVECIHRCEQYLHNTAQGSICGLRKMEREIARYVP